MIGWTLCAYRDQCTLCGHWSRRVWRYFVNQTTSTMSVCTQCADDLHTSTEPEAS